MAESMRRAARSASGVGARGVAAPPNVVQLSARGGTKNDNRNNINNNANVNPFGGNPAAAAQAADGEPSTESFAKKRSRGGGR